MMRISEMFYGSVEERPGFMVQTSAQQIIRDPKLFTQDLPPPPKPPAPAPVDKNKPVVMEVSICCSSCVDILKHDMSKVKGVKDVESDIFRNKVTVTGEALGVADVISAARRHFKDAKLWE